MTLVDGWTTHIFQGQYLVCLQCKLHLVSHENHKTICKQPPDTPARDLHTHYYTIPYNAAHTVYKFSSWLWFLLHAKTDEKGLRDLKIATHKKAMPLKCLYWLYW